MELQHRETIDHLLAMSHGSLADKASVWPVSINLLEWLLCLPQDMQVHALLLLYNQLYTFLQKQLTVLHINCLGQWWGRFKLGMYTCMHYHGQVFGDVHLHVLHGQVQKLI